MFGIFADLLSSVITILFPAFASYKAIRSADPAQLKPWLMYWVVLSGILLAESWTVFIIGWLPFYSWIRLFFLAYLVLPQTQGARIIYQEHVEPFFEHHEREIEELIGRTHERAKALGLQYFFKAVDWIREKILGLPPQRPATAAPPPATGPATYAQALLSRFNLPTTTGGNLPSTGSDWYSILASAVTSVTSTGKSRDAQAEELSASGILQPEKVASLSRAEKAKFYSSQRERLEVLISALAKEEGKLRADEGANDDLAYGSFEGLRKNMSENSFDHIQHEDVGGPLPMNPPKRSSEGWTSGWFGGGSAKRTTSSSSSGAEFAARAVDEIARASGVDR
ncbi:hypothetical protein VTN96DRAFT_891 [Rasamsonia emersonii]|uniref:Protein YOP1 n=1 Tax=Rasamsonia emersonii (strain ATCC 16479 / CBS 393.64 / IMI 116815) TaxID=1408163 RepID=A0A0F4YJ72_RASE3|nr:HVA22 domain membrane protein [Rasamsonia emersonii CBS 393.64]KKA18274.1 HVA22 domain membrane protein [Rasamsonia emersonii CBS 393.64]